ncbi:MAG: hypothetical protein MUD16_17965 [Desulfobacterales bacterium]|jgi:hypothetical protein|nr:hypothetical protein [Desulfobacterales bacterium]
MKRVRLLPAVLLVVGVLGLACESRHPWEGRYAGRHEQGPFGAVLLTLEGGGKGQWNAGQESTLLRWEERRGLLWLHLKSGGVMVARPLPGQPALSIELPGIGALTLRKEP